MTRTIRAFNKEDISTCMEIFRDNMPCCFDHSEEEEFLTFLNYISIPYFVVIEDDHIVACGGYVIDDKEKIASLAWGMVQHNQHKTGLGKMLLEARLERIKQDLPGGAIRLDTSQRTYGFYQKYGFEITEITKDGYGPGLHRHEMRLQLPG